MAQKRYYELKTINAKGETRYDFKACHSPKDFLADYLLADGEKPKSGRVYVKRGEQYAQTAPTLEYKPITREYYESCQQTLKAAAEYEAATNPDLTADSTDAEEQRLMAIRKRVDDDKEIRLRLSVNDDSHLTGETIFDDDAIRALGFDEFLNRENHDAFVVKANEAGYTVATSCESMYRFLTSEQPASDFKDGLTYSREEIEAEPDYGLNLPDVEMSNEEFETACRAAGHSLSDIIEDKTGYEETEAALSASPAVYHEETRDGITEHFVNGQSMAVSFADDYPELAEVMTEKTESEFDRRWREHNAQEAAKAADKVIRITRSIDQSELTGIDKELDAVEGATYADKDKMNACNIPGYLHISEYPEAIKAMRAHGYEVEAVDLDAGHLFIRAGYSNPPVYTGENSGDDEIIDAFTGDGALYYDITEVEKIAALANKAGYNVTTPLNYFPNTYKRLDSTRTLNPEPKQSARVEAPRVAAPFVPTLSKRQQRRQAGRLFGVRR